MAKKGKLESILQRYHQGACSPDEIKWLETWYLRMGENSEVAEPSDENIKELLDRIRNSPRFKPQRTIRSSRATVAKIAAAAAILVTIGISIWFLIFQPAAVTRHYVTAQTGYGEIKKIALPDGSTVWLNAKSQISYPEHFKKMRELHLIGEAAFEVQKDRKHPFSVFTADSLKTVVLGTTFNVKNYPGTNETVVSVVTGKVSVGKRNLFEILGAGDELMYQHASGKQHRSAGNEGGTAWLEGNWRVNGKGISGLAVLLESQFGVTLTSTTPHLDSLQINANFHRNQGVDEILEAFCAIAGCNHKWVSSNNIMLY